jgi:ferredoxin--NADP+ reductase
MAKWLEGIVVENHRWTERLTSLKIEAALGPVQAGQFVRIGLEIDGEIVARPYSLVNPPQQPPLEIYFNIVPEGPLSPRLFALENGEKVLVATNPAGFLTVSEVPETRHLWMMATSTGVGPFLSILGTDAVWQRFQRVILCYSVRTEQELAYSSAIAEIAETHADKFCFVPTITREDTAYSIRARFPESIKNGELENAAEVTLSAEDSHVMMCGNSEMIKQVSSVLETRGMRRHRRREPGHFTSEKYH